MYQKDISGHMCKQFNNRVLTAMMTMMAIASVQLYGNDENGNNKQKELKTMTSGLQYVDYNIGEGAAPKKGQPVTVHYTGKLNNGNVFDSSYNRGEPFTFVYGVGQVIAGWDEGLKTMKVGGKRQLVIPAHLAYGGQSVGSIPANSTLTFEVELLSVND